jgi:hypothetical protein
MLHEKDVIDFTIDSTISTTTDKDINNNNISLSLKYNIWDNKEKNDFIKKNLKTKNSLIDKAKNYYLTKDLINNLQIKLDFLYLKDERLKRRVISGIVNLDDRIALIDSILELNSKISQNKIKLENLKTFLLNNLKSEIEKYL